MAQIHLENSGHIIRGFLIIPYIALNTNLPEKRSKLFKIIMFLALAQIVVALIKGAYIQNFSLDAYEKWLSAFSSLALLYGLFSLFLFNKYSKKKFYKHFTPIIFTLGIIILIIASNRSVWVAGVVGFIFLILTKEINIKNQILVLFIILFVLIIASQLFSAEGYNFSNFFSQRLDVFSYKEDPTSSWRYFYWITIFNSIILKPFFGYGLGGSFGIYVPELKDVITTSPHNLYFAMLYELGAVGSTLFLVFIAKYLKDLRKLKLLLPMDNIIKITLFVVIFCAISYWIAYSSDKDFFTWCYLGLALSLLINKTETVSESET